VVSIKNGGVSAGSAAAGPEAEVPRRRQGELRCGGGHPFAVPRPRRKGSSSPSVFVFNSFVLLPLQLLLLQAGGHLEASDPMRPPRRPHNPLSFLGPPLRRALRCCRQRRLGGAGAGEDAGANGLEMQQQAAAEKPAAAGAAAAAAAAEAPAKAEAKGAAPPAAGAAAKPGELPAGKQEGGAAAAAAGNERGGTAAAKPEAPPVVATGPPTLEDVLAGGPGVAADPGLWLVQPVFRIWQPGLGGRAPLLKLEALKAQRAPGKPPAAIAVCRLPSLGKLFMLHLGPKPPPGQEDAVSSGAFRVPFKTGDADRWGGRCQGWVNRHTGARWHAPACLPCHC
jgi:hypothetical protein